MKRDVCLFFFSVKRGVLCTPLEVCLARRVDRLRMYSKRKKFRLQLLALTDFLKPVAGTEMSNVFQNWSEIVEPYA